MVSKDVQVNTNAKNATEAAQIVQLASHFDSDISIEADNKKASAKSLLSMMYLVQHLGETGMDQVKISARGNDEEEAIRRLEAYLAGKKGV